MFGNVSVEEADRDLGAARYAAQEQAIEAYCEARRLCLVRIVRDFEPAGRRTAAIPGGLRQIVDGLAAGVADGVVVAELERLASAAGTLGPALRWLDERRCALVALDVGLDTSTPDGLQSARTLADAGDGPRPAGHARTAAHGGGPPGGEDDAVEPGEQIVAMRARGLSLEAIAAALKRQGL